MISNSYFKLLKNVMRTSKCGIMWLILLLIKIILTKNKINSMFCQIVMTLFVNYLYVKTSYIDI